MMAAISLTGAAVFAAAPGNSGPAVHRHAVYGVNITASVSYGTALYCEAANFSQTNCSTIELLLDVLRPTVNASLSVPLPTTPRPVMLGIHGGSYSHGSSSMEYENLEYFVRRGWIGFSINCDAPPSRRRHPSLSQCPPPSPPTPPPPLAPLPLGSSEPLAAISLACLQPAPCTASTTLAVTYESDSAFSICCAGTDRVCNQKPYTPPPGSGSALPEASSTGNLVCSQFGSFPAHPPYGNASCARCRHPTTWTILQHDGPNHLVLWCNVLPDLKWP